MPSSSPVPWGKPLCRQTCHGFAEIPVVISVPTSRGRGSLQSHDHLWGLSKAVTTTGVKAKTSHGSLLWVPCSTPWRGRAAPAGFALPRDAARGCSSRWDRAGRGAGAAGPEQPLQAWSNPDRVEHPGGRGKPRHVPASPPAKQHISLSQLGWRPGSKGSVSLLCQHLEEKGGENSHFCQTLGMWMPRKQTEALFLQ